MCIVILLDNMFQNITFQLKAYAMFQTTAARIDDTYMGRAVTGDMEINYKNNTVYGKSHGVQVTSLLYAYQIVPFIVAFVVLVSIASILCYLLCQKDRKEMREKLSSKLLHIFENNTKHQANIAAIVVMCILATIHNFILDAISFHCPPSLSLPKYYGKHNCYNAIDIYTTIFAIVSLLCLLVAPFFVLCSYCYSTKHNEWNSDQRAKFHLLLLIALVLCIGSTVLSFSFHIPIIIIAWTTNPFYASKIALYYGIIISVYFVTLKNAYFLPAVLFEREKCKTKQWICCGSFSMVVAAVVLFSVHIVSVLFFVFIPINHSITESVSGVQALYHSVILLVAGVITYNVVWFYFLKLFSAEKALEKALKEIEKPQWIADNSEWKDLSEEERMKRIIVSLFKQVQNFSAETTLRNALSDMTTKPQFIADNCNWEDLSEEDRMKKIIIYLVLLVKTTPKHKSRESQV